jgi:hypothetical protein
VETDALLGGELCEAAAVLQVLDHKPQAAPLGRCLVRESLGYKVVAAARSAAILEDSGAAVIDRATATDGRGRAAVVVNAFSVLANRPGPLADLIGALSARMSEGKATAAVVVGAAMGDVRQAIRRELKALGVPGG